MEADTRLGEGADQDRDVARDVERRRWRHLRYISGYQAGQTREGDLAAGWDREGDGTPFDRAIAAERERDERPR